MELESAVESSCNVAMIVCRQRLVGVEFKEK